MAKVGQEDIVAAQLMRDNEETMARSLNLILAIVWLTLGVALLALYRLDPQAAGAWEYRGLPGLVCLAMTVYNLMRWWSLRSRRQKPGVDWDAFRRRPRPEPLSDSTFPLTDQPPPIRRPPSEQIKPANDPPRS